MKEMQMAKTASRIINQLLSVQPGEDLLILTDTERPRTITKALATVAGAAEAHTTVMIMESVEAGGVEPPESVAAALKDSDAVIIQTSYPLTHTNAHRRP